jgi:hypothetical protein
MQNVDSPKQIEPGRPALTAKASAEIRRSSMKTIAANSGNTMSLKALHYIQKLKAHKP